MNRLKELRKEKGLTQQGLADIVGVTKRTIIAWENRERDIKTDKAQQLADYFEVSVGYLLGYSEERAIPLEEFILQMGDVGTEVDGISHLNKEQFIQGLKNVEQEQLRPVYIDNIKQNLNDLTIPDIALVHALTERLVENQNIEKS